VGGNDMKVLWLVPPSKIKGEIPLVGNNRWFKYTPFMTNYIYPIIAANGATMIKKDGHDIKFLDCPATGVPEFRAMWAVMKYDLIIMEARTAIINWIHEFIGKINHINPNIRVALYGDHVMQKPMESLKYADYIINSGDYDFGARELVNQLSKGEYPLRIFKTPLATEEELNNMPNVDRELVPWQNYFEAWRHREKFSWFQSSRGCWGSCTFCSWVKIFYHQTMRLTDPIIMAEKIEYANSMYGINEFLDDADTFLPSWGMVFGKKLLDKGLDIYWNAQTRADTIALTPIEDLKYLKKTGLHIIKLGIDGGNDITLRKIRKGYTMETVEKAMKKLKKANLESHLNFVLGFPWESKKDSYDIIKWAKKLNPNQAQFSLIQPFIGTEIYEQSIENNWFNIDPNDYDSWDMKQPILKGKMTAKEIAKLHKDAWAKFYLSPKFITKQAFKSLWLTIKERNLDSFRHLWRGFQGVYKGHMRAVNEKN
jgi:radical SAM superfamily enzyme YgiQ (UPF0313 family)